MILKQTKLNIADNTGVTGAICIGILSKKKQHGIIGDYIILSIKTVNFEKKIKKGEVRRGVLVRQHQPIFRKNGIIIQFHKNAVVILNSKSNNPIGNRIRGPIAKELRKKKWMKLISMASILI